MANTKYFTDLIHHVAWRVPPILVEVALGLARVHARSRVGGWVGALVDGLSGCGQIDGHGQKVDERRHFQDERHQRPEEREEDARDGSARLHDYADGEPDALDERDYEEENDQQNDGDYDCEDEPRGAHGKVAADVGGPGECGVGF